jgi:hypothetical protein
VQADYEAVEAVRRLIAQSQRISAYQILAQLPIKEQDMLLELQNAAGNAFQLLHDATTASNGHSKMMSVAHAIENMKRFVVQLDALQGIELVEGLLYQDIRSEAERIIEFISAEDADDGEGF